METPKTRNKDFAFLLLSLLLALFVIGWDILDVRLSTGTSSFTIHDLIMFVGGCIGAALGVWGIHHAKRAGLSWQLAVLSVLGLSANGLILFFASNAWLNPPEVKGIVQRIGDDYILIEVDKDYQEEYRTAHSPYGFTTDLIAGVSSRTIFYEQYGNWRWQKKVVSQGNVQEGQHVRIKYNGSRLLTGDILEAGEIVILDE